MRSILLPLLTFAALVACGGSDDAPVGDDTAYTSDPDKTVVVGGATGSATASGASTAQPSQGCVTLPSGQCVDAKSCADGERRDVVLDSAGKVVAVVCYPANANPPEVNAEGNVDLGKTANGGVVAIDGANDGVDITGNVTSKGNNVVVYGSGPDVSVIGGNVSAEGNNFSMRGVRVKGDVTISGGNNATMVLCVIEGNLTITGNNNVVAECTVLGNITIVGNNNVLVGNEVGGAISVSEAKNLTCDGNVKWSDANANKIVDPGETGAALACTTDAAPSNPGNGKK